MTQWGIHELTRARDYEAIPTATTTLHSGYLNKLITTPWLYAIFFDVELMISVLAFRLDGENMRPLWLLFFQRFAYRQLMYIVACRAMWKAIIGWRQGWGTLQRTGTVSLPTT